MGESPSLPEAITGAGRGPRASVIVPTRDRPPSLARCLAALERLDGIEQLEIVVVDDGTVPSGDVAEVVARSPAARLVRREQPGGAGAARNDGAKAVRAPIILFTDDDCEPAPDWAMRLASVIEEGADAAGGALLNGRPRDALAAASETVTAYFRRQALGPGRTTTFASSNNLACKAGVLAEVPFDESFQHAGEDRDWCVRVVGAGYSLVVDPGAAVVHHQELTFRSFWEKHLGYGRGAYRFRQRNFSTRRLEPPRFYIGLLRAGFAQGARIGLFVALAQLATGVGFAREALWWNRATR